MPFVLLDIKLLVRLINESVWVFFGGSSDGIAETEAHWKNEVTFVWIGLLVSQNLVDSLSNSIRAGFAFVDNQTEFIATITSGKAAIFGADLL